MHVLFCGATMTGKTTLARQIERELAKRGYKTIVYDPVGTETKGGGWSEESDVYDDPDEFFREVRKAQDAHVFIDEASTELTVSDKSRYWLLTRGRHYGLSCYLITQRPKLIAPTVRTQCARCYMFRMSRDDMRELGNDFTHSDVHNIRLEKGEYLILDTTSPTVLKANVFAPGKKPSTVNTTSITP